MRVLCRANPKLATKYCFCLRSTIIDRATRKPVGLIFGYGATVNTVSKRVEQVAVAMQREESLCCDEVELVLHDECPMEITDDVYVHFFKNSPLDGYDSELTD